MQHRIYVLEDDKDIGYILQLFLTEEGYDVRVFPTITDIKKQTQLELPDLFLMDIMLPDGDGLSLCQAFKENGKASHIPVLMMSAHLNPERMGPEVQADGFIAKPFDLDAVSSRLHRLLHPVN